MKEQEEYQVAFEREVEKSFQETLKNYPTREAALLPTLWLAVGQFGCLSSEVIAYVAGRLGLSPVRVFAAVEFYSMFHREPVGRFHIQLCRNLSCTLLGSERILAFLEEELGIRPGEKTKDDAFSLELVECLGSCGTAPVMRVNDCYYENLSIERVRDIIESCREGELPPGGEGPKSG